MAGGRSRNRCDGADIVRRHSLRHGRRRARDRRSFSISRPDANGVTRSAGGAWRGDATRQANAAGGGKNPWSAEDVRLLIALWTDGAHVLSIAEALGRTRGAIYSKRRRLGLPSRDRKPRPRLSIDESCAAALAWHGEIARDPDLFSGEHQSAQPFETPRVPTSSYRAPSARRAMRDQTGDLWENSAAVGVTTAVPVDAVEVLEALREGFETPASLWPDFGELSVWDAPPLPGNAPKKSRRISIRKLSADQKTEIEHRGLAGQRPKAIARDMGVTDCQVTSRLWRSEVAVLRQEFGVILVDSYDPAVAAENIKNWRLAKRPAWTHGGDKPREPYWWVRGRHNLPRFYTHSKSYKGLA